MWCIMFWSVFDFRKVFKYVQSIASILTDELGK